MDMISQDIRYALRALTKARAFTAIALVCLAVGIGVNTAIFSVVNGMLFRSLPFADGDRLTTIWSTNERRDIEDAGISWADLRDLRDSGIFEDVAGARVSSLTVTATDQPERIEGSAVTPNLFGLVGVRPQLGRSFRDDEGAAAGFEQVAIISDGLWKRSFGSDPNILERTIHINGRQLQIVGVMPADFRFPETADIWLPLGPEIRNPMNREARGIWGMGKLKAGATIEAADRQVKQLAARWSRDLPDTNRDWSLHALSYRDSIIDANAQRLMYLMLGAVAFVLLIACANVANLLLARGTDRAREIAVRAALGGSRRRIIRQLLTESLLLALTGGALGIIIAVWWVDAMMRTIPEELPYWVTFRLDGAVLLYTALISVATGLLFGVMPALQATRTDLQSSLRDSGRGGSENRAQNRTRSALVIAEIALSMVLLVGAALMVQSFMRLRRADPGFDASSMLSLRLRLTGDRYDTLANRAQYFRTVEQRLSAMPGVVGAAVTGAIPADDGGWRTDVRAVGDNRSQEDAIGATMIPEGVGFFDAIGAKLIAGRDFRMNEMGDTLARVAILGAGLARKLFGNTDPLNREIRVGQHTFTVIGIAPDLQYEEFGEDTEQDRLQFHVPFAQNGGRAMNLLLRTQSDPDQLVGAVRNELRAIDPTLAAWDVMTMDQRRLYTTWPNRLFGKTFGTFGAAALLLAISGVYGVMAYSVARRKREIGVRIALGATPSDILRLVVGRAGVLAGLGVAIGITLAFAVSRLLAGLIWGVSTSDPLTFLVTPLLLTGAALLASYIPARRASRVEPMVALRAE